jgi:acyl-coenzyme A synthetase/AMP-(fatty) acid ligase
MAWVAERVAPYKRLHGVEFVERLPRTPGGKLLRRLLPIERHGWRSSGSGGRRMKARGDQYV